MITELTEEQTSLLEVYKNKWLDIGLSTAGLDVENAKEAVDLCYRSAGLKPPKNFIHCLSPLDAASKAVELGVSNKKMAVSHMIYGAHSAGWLAFYDYMQAVLKIDIPQINGLIDLAKHSGWWAPYEDYAILQDRPNTIKWDDQNRLHNEKGPSILYSDGFAVHTWHGTRVPGEWIESDSLTPKIALTWENLEQRRAACEIITWARILDELSARTINEDDDPEIGTLIDVDLPDIGTERFLRARCGTGRMFALPVPPEMKTAHQANAWLWRKNPEDYHPEVRT